MCTTWLPNSFSLVASFFLFSSFTSFVLITDLFSTVRHPAVNWSKRYKCLIWTLIHLGSLSLVCLLFVLGLQKFVNSVLSFCSLKKTIVNALINLALFHLFAILGHKLAKHAVHILNFPKKLFGFLLFPDMLSILDFLLACTKQESYFFPIRGRMFCSSICSIWLGSIAEGFWHFLTPASKGTPTSDQLFDQCFHTTKCIFQVKMGPYLMVHQQRNFNTILI